LLLSLPGRTQRSAHDDAGESLFDLRRAIVGFGNDAWPVNDDRCIEDHQRYELSFSISVGEMDYRLVFLIASI